MIKVHRGRKIPISILGKLTDEHYHGPKSFEMVLDFGQTFEKMRGKTVPAGERRTRSTDRLKIYSETYPRITKLMQELTEKYAVLPGEPWKDPEKRFSYQQILSEVYKPMVADVYQEGIENIVGMAIIEGGLFVEQFYKLPRAQRAYVLEKRLDYKKGKTTGMALGISELRLPEGYKGRETLLVYEDCTATGVSAVGLLIFLIEKGIDFGRVELHFAAATQRGIEFIFKKAKSLEVDVDIKTGIVVYGLNKNFYLMRTTEEKKLDGSFYKGSEPVVSDMGSFAKKLTVEYNNRAWWNVER